MLKPVFICILVLMIGSAATYIDQVPYTTFKNASFEDPNPRASASPDGWTSKTSASTPDIMPGAWGLQIPALHGKTCLGLVTRDDGSVEDVAQMLAKPLKNGDCYAFTIYLSHAQQYVGYNQPCRLRVWGGDGVSAKQELLASSPLISHAAWKPYQFKFVAGRDIPCITLEVYYGPGTTFKYKGNILMDNCSAIEQCEKA
jgi:hypothetical protein